MAVAYGPDYEAYVERVTRLVEGANSQVKKLMRAMREGDRVASNNTSVHARVVAALGAHGDAALAQAVVKFPELVPDGRRGFAEAKKVFTEDTVRARFTSPPNEETRAVALWTLGVLDAATAQPLAFEVLDGKASEHLLAAALHVVAPAAKAEGAKALEHAARLLATHESVFVWSGAQAVLCKSKHERLDATLEQLLDTLDLDRGGYVVVAVRDRKRKTVARALARFAKRTHDGLAKKLVAQWG